MALMAWDRYVEPAYPLWRHLLPVHAPMEAAERPLPVAVCAEMPSVRRAYQTDSEATGILDCDYSLA